MRMSSLLTVTVPPSSNRTTKCSPAGIRVPWRIFPLDRWISSACAVSDRSRTPASIKTDFMASPPFEKQPVTRVRCLQIPAIRSRFGDSNDLKRNPELPRGRRGARGSVCGCAEREEVGGVEGVRSRPVDVDGTSGTVRSIPRGVIQEQHLPMAPDRPLRRERRRPHRGRSASTNSHIRPWTRARTGQSRFRRRGDGRANDRESRYDPERAPRCRWEEC